LEIGVLGHQRRVLTRRGKRPRYSTPDQAFLAAVSRFLPRERWSDFSVVPDMLKRWRRKLERGTGSRERRGPGRPRIDPALADLIFAWARRTPGGGLEAMLSFEKPW
jgi:putative transposase